MSGLVEGALACWAWCVSIATFAAQSAIYDEKWVCVVVAGVELGWLQVSHVKSVECDLEKYKNHADARFDLVVSSSTSPMQMIVMKPETRAFVETVGKYLRPLSMKDSKGFSIATLLYCCKNLDHLDLEGCNLKFEASDELDDHPEQEWGLGTTLVSLNLNRTSFNDTDMRYLKWDLEDPFRLRKLKELHLYRVQMTHIGLDDLFVALIMNKTLSILELEQPGNDINDTEK